MEDTNDEEGMITTSTIIGAVVIALVIACGLIACVVSLLLSYVGAFPWIF
jgi:hypothetical protein